MKAKSDKQNDSGLKRVIDPNDPAWSSVEKMTEGMTPQERSKKLMEFCAGLKTRDPNKDTNKLRED